MADKRIGLGRGIGALIPTSDNPNEAPIDVFFPAGGSIGENLVPVPGARFGHLDINSIRPNAKQPRSVFEPEAFTELVHSIKELGVLQPIVVRSIPGEAGKYELIMGERRLRASKEAGLAKIPAVIRETADENMLRDALLENLHRSDLNPLEEASAYQQLLEDFGITQEQLANRIGRSRPKITNSIRLLKLPAEVQRKVAAGVLSAGHARALLAIEDPSRQLDLANKVINEGLSVRSLEEIVAIAKPGGGGKGKVRPGGRQDMLKGLAEQVGDHLSTKVKISIGAGKGTIAIEFGSLEDLKRIVKEIGVDAEY
ncbi:MAG: ParB/RepB/Spo0J family partition protein [Rhodoluna sp.]|nr:ParB/RepB/Spo0J family partition protein [Rhodoluna sp.]